MLTQRQGDAQAIVAQKHPPSLPIQFLPLAAAVEVQDALVPLRAHLHAGHGEADVVDAGDGDRAILAVPTARVHWRLDGRPEMPRAHLPRPDMLLSVVLTLLLLEGVAPTEGYPLGGSPPALGWVPWRIVPHGSSGHPESLDADRAVQALLRAEPPFRTLRDGHAIGIDGTEEGLVGALMTPGERGASDG